jgi:hypothetical protein
VFSSLDRIDIVLTRGPDGRRRYVQTDHRTADEIEQEPALSTLFALVRVLNPKRTIEAGSPEPDVAYSVRDPPPVFLRRAIRAAGGRVVVGLDEVPVADAEDLPRLGEVVASAFAGVAGTTASEYGSASIATASGRWSARWPRWPETPRRTRSRTGRPC